MDSFTDWQAATESLVCTWTSQTHLEGSFILTSLLTQVSQIWLSPLVSSNDPRTSEAKSIRVIIDFIMCSLLASIPRAADSDGLKLCVSKFPSGIWYCIVLRITQWVSKCFTVLAVNEIQASPTDFCYNYNVCEALDLRMYHSWWWHRARIESHLHK